eukprot:403332075
MGNYANCCEKNNKDLPDNVNQGDMGVDSSKRPTRERMQNGGGAHAIINTDELSSSQRHKNKGRLVAVDDKNQGSGQKSQQNGLMQKFSSSDLKANNIIGKPTINLHQQQSIKNDSTVLSGLNGRSINNNVNENNNFQKTNNHNNQQESDRSVGSSQSSYIPKVPRKALLQKFNVDVDVIEASHRIDQRNEGQNQFNLYKQDSEKPMNILEQLEKNFQEVYNEQDQEDKGKSNVLINSRMLVSERRNPIEINYEILEHIGQGGFGEVKKVRHKELNIIRALKIIKKSKYKSTAELKMIKNEIAIMKLVDHPNIVKLFEFFEDDEQFFIITEYCSGGQLFEMIRQKRQFTENEAAQIMMQLLSAIAHCHLRKVVHRDVKPENLLVDITGTNNENYAVKIIDFGISTTFDPEQKLTLSIGTPYYVAPEVIQKQYNEKCDVWSCGVILYILLCGYPPFAARNQNEIYQKILKGTFSFTSQEWSSVSKLAKDFIKKLLQKHASNRISAADALNDPWIKQFTEKSKIQKPICVSALNQLKNFQCERKLEQAVVAYITNSMMSKQTEERLMQTFKQFDKNNDGILTIDELREGFKEFMGEQILFEDELQQIIKNVDFNQNGLIEYSEFVSAASNLKHLLTEKNLKQAFDLFDLDQNGEITPRELKHILGGKNEDLKDEEWEHLINDFDKNGDGMINFDEFKNMMYQLHVNQKNMGAKEGINILLGINKANPDDSKEMISVNNTTAIVNQSNQQ